MDKQEIEEKVKDIVADHLGINKEEIKTESILVDDLGADSLDEVELVMCFEEEFDIEISDEEAEKLRTVSDAVKHIASAL